MLNYRSVPSNYIRMIISIKTLLCQKEIQDNRKGSHESRKALYLCKTNKGKTYKSTLMFLKVFVNKYSDK